VKVVVPEGPYGNKGKEEGEEEGAIRLRGQGGSMSAAHRGSDLPTVLVGIGQVRFEDGHRVSTAHYRLSREVSSERWHADITCEELPNLESLREQRLVLELADGRDWHFTVDSALECVERPPGLITPPSRSRADSQIIG
jgi:hypothetical protein